MREINCTDLRIELTHICDEIMMEGGKWVITRYGKRLAVLIPYREDDGNLPKLKKPRTPTSSA